MKVNLLYTRCNLVFERITRQKRQIVFFGEQIKSNHDKGSAVGAMPLDFKKAFDTVNHKLSKCNVSVSALT